MPRSPSRSRSRSRSRSPPRRTERSQTPDDRELAPFLIRVFVTKGKHTPLLDFDDGKFPFRDEFHVYGWKSSTPTSLIALLYPSFPAPYRSPLARFAFRHVYVDASQRGLYRSKDLVSFSGRDLMNTLNAGSSSTAKGKKVGVDMDMELDDAPSASNGNGHGGGRKVIEKSLDDYGFITGDYLSVSLYVPEPKLAPPIGNAPLAPLTRDREPRSAPNNGEWARGEALPPRAKRGGFGGGDDRGGRDGGYRGAPGPPAVLGMGIRGGAGRRSPSVGRDRNGAGRRSRSPDYGRRRDRSP